MAKENANGMITSLAIHGLLVGGLVLFSGVTAVSRIEKPQDGTFMVELVGDGDGAPGIIGQAPGLADGTLQGDPKEQTSGLFPTDEANQVLDSLRAELAAAEKQEQARIAAEARARREAEEKKKQLPPTRDPQATETQKRTSKGSEKISLEEFQQGQKKPAGQSKGGNSRKGSASGASRQIKGVRIGGSGGNSFGVAGGVGNNGGGGGNASAHALYSGRITMLLQRHWQQLLLSDGSGLDSSINGTFLLNISANGNISFGGWVKDPRNPLFESLLLRAIREVGNCGPRPAGYSATVESEISARPE